MKRKLLTHKFLASILMISSASLGILYLFIQEPMSYHKEFLQVDYNSLPPKVQEFMLGLIHLLGCGFLSYAALLYYFSHKMPKRGVKEYSYLLIVGLLFMLAPLQYFTLKVGNGAPWWVVSVLILVAIANLLVLRKQAGCKGKCLSSQCKMHSTILSPS